MLDNGTYRIYVTCIPDDDDNYLYLPSLESGNPLEYVKDKPSLELVENFTVGQKQSGNNTILASWSKVNNADEYYINLYYAPTHNSAIKSVLIDEITVVSNQLNLGDYISKEGEYTLKIKAVAKSVYDSSAFATFTYNYNMTVDSDFKRNRVQYGGESYSHYVTSYKQLESLLSYYYLYNNLQYFEDNTSSYYQLKVMLGEDIDKINEQCVNANYGFENMGTTTIEKLYEISKIGLSNYAENIYLKNNLLAQPKEISESGNQYYIFSIESGLKADKLSGLDLKQDNLRFDEKQNLLLDSQKRNDNYIFDLETKNKIDVTTSEQLFMAVQYDLNPNFVGASDVAETIYNEAKDILLTICNDDMTDYEKVCSIYDWLISNVEYNYKYDEIRKDKTLDQSVSGNDANLIGDLKYEYLESVFLNAEDRSAVANGLSKAFVLLCRLEGIEAIKVNGTINGLDHYWNKVYIDGRPNDDSDTKSWFSLDIANSYTDIAINSVGYQLPTHKYFLVTDSYLKSKLNVTEKFLPKNVVSDVQINYFANTTYKYKKSVQVNEGNNISTIKYEGSGTLKYLTSTGSAENYIIDIMRYLVTESNGKNNCVVEVDMANSPTAIDTLLNNVKTTYYNQVSKDFKMLFRVEAIAYENIIIIAITPN